MQLAFFMMLCSFSNGKKCDLPSGVYYDGKLEYSLQYANSGGAVASPEKGSSYRLRLFEKNKETNSLKPDISNAKVYISGFRYNGIKYSKPEGIVDFIRIDDTEITLNQGVYEKNNPKVVSVDFLSFNIKSRDDARIRIIIKMKNGKRIDIVYCGPISYDGLY